MSIHFAPQWVKPIKPSGTSTTPTTDTPPSTLGGRPAHLSGSSPAPSSTGNASSVPFPALGGTHNAAVSPSTASSLSHNPNGMSYSRATHTPLSPNNPGESSYFPYTEGGASNGLGFKYTREQMLALWEEDKVKELPIELVQLLSDGRVLVSKNVQKPVGLREQTEVEKKLLATTVHPPTMSRRQPNANANSNAGVNAANPGPGAVGESGSGPGGSAHPQSANPSRRSMGPMAMGGGGGGGVKDGVLGSGARSAFGGFGRGEGGALGGGGGPGGKFGSGPLGGAQAGGGAGAEGRMPGSLGGGFGGVGRRMGSRRNDAIDPSAEPTRGGSAPWRPVRTSSGGNFEGVLGFGSTPQSHGQSRDHAAPPQQQSQQQHPDASQAGQPAGQASWEQVGAPENADKKPEINFGNGGGPGWGSGQKKWRIATGASGPGDEKTLHVPIATYEPSTESVRATPSATPVPDRDAALSVVDPSDALAAQDMAQIPSAQEQAPLPEPQVDLGAVQWMYKDPAGQEQGPFSGANMHEWYSHSYFQDDLPIRRVSETEYHTLAILKTATGNAVQPFLSPVRPKPEPPRPVVAPPPNLPGPWAQAPGAPLHDTFRGMNIASPAGGMGGMGGFPPPQQGGFPGDRLGGFGGMPLPGQMGAGSPFGGMSNPAFAAIGAGPIGSPLGQQPFGMRQASPFGQQQQPYSPFGAPGAISRSNEPFSQTPGYGHYPQTAPFEQAPIGSPAYVPIPQQQQMLHQQHQYPVQPQYQQQQQPIQPPQPAHAAPWSSQPQQEVQQPVQQVQQDASVQPPTEQSQDEPSYFPPVEQVTEAAEETAGPAAESASAPEDPAPAQAEEEEAEVAEPEQVNEAAMPVPVPPPSVWGQKATTGGKTPSAPSSRKQSVNVDATPATPTPVSATAAGASAAQPSATASKTARTAASTAESTPAKAAGAAAAPASAAATPTAPSPSNDKPPASKPAPWAKDDVASKPSPSGPSLREIQEAEAKRVEARRQALAEARANAPSPSTATSGADEIPTSLTWGLPSSGSGKSAAAAAAAAGAATTPTTPGSGASGSAWGSGDAAPKKTLKQIQEEEEKRQRKIAQAKAAALAAAQGGSPAGSPAAAAQLKRGYADLAATPSAAPAGPGWTTVGAGGKAGAAPSPSPAPASAARPTAVAAAAATPSKPSAAPAVAKPSIVTSVSKPATSNGAKPSSDEVGPSLEFIKWTKGALAGLTVNLDDFMQMLLSFPADPPSSQKADIAEIIADSVYAASSTLDGRRFAQEFMTRRKADVAKGRAGAAAGGANGMASAGGSGAPGLARASSLADVVKSMPVKPPAEAGFKVVKAKGKKKN